MNRLIRVQNGRSGAFLGHRVQMARGWWRGDSGFAGQPELPQGSGILLAPCASVHTLGMQGPVDVLFLDRKGRVVEMWSGLQPGKFAVGGQGVYATLQLPSGTLEETGTRNGDVLILEDTADLGECPPAPMNGQGGREA